VSRTSSSKHRIISRHRSDRDPDFRANSLEQFLHHVLNIRKRWQREDAHGGFLELWFRGHQAAGWELKPSLFRYEYDESLMRKEFCRLAPQYLQERTQFDQWDWYFLQQHYGTPTRLLDWSDGALIALYFAVRRNLTSFDPMKRSTRDEHDGCAAAHQGDAAVWVLDPFWLNEKALGERSISQPGKELAGWLPTGSRSRIDKGNPVALDPPHIIRRIAVQRSHFTLFGTDPDGLIRIAERGGGRLAKIAITAEAIDDIRADLQSCGIKETTVYPDLEGLSRELREDWRRRR
jgi:hypothetical protein